MHASSGVPGRHVTRVKLFILKAAQVKISKAPFSPVTDLLPNIVLHGCTEGLP